MIMNELAVFLLRTKAIDDLPLIVSIGLLLNFFDARHNDSAQISNGR